MKRNYLFTLYIFIICSILLICCGKKDSRIYSQHIINREEASIDLINIESKEGIIEITEESDIKKLILKLSNIEVKKLSKEDEIEVLKDKITKKEYLYPILISSNKDLIGAVLVLSEENIVFFDTESMKSNQRTISFINLDKNYVKEIISTINELVYDTKN